MKIFNKPTVPTLDALKPSQLVSGELSREDWRKRMLEGYKGILLGNPIQYRGFGPFWWILKKEMLDAGIADFGDSLDAEWVERIDYGDPVLNILSAYAYAEYAEEYGLLYSSGHTVEFIGDDDEVINDDYVLADDFMELRAAGRGRYLHSPQKIPRQNFRRGIFQYTLCPYLSSPSTRSSPSAAGVCPFGGPFWGQTSSNDSSSLFKTSVQTK